MPEETPKQTSPQTEGKPYPKTIMVAEHSSAHAVPLKRRHVVTACAAGLCLCFFLPWVHILFFTPSGLDLSKGEGNAWLYWCLPVFALVACVAGAAGKGYRFPALLAGLTPFAILFYGFNQLGNEVFQNLAVGGWAGLGLGATLFIAALK